MAIGTSLSSAEWRERGSSGSSTTLERPSCAVVQRSWRWGGEIGGRAMQREVRQSREPSSMINTVS